MIICILWHVRCCQAGMIEGLFARGNYQAAKVQLDAVNARHQALAANLANVETPGYQRVDLKPEFQREFAEFMELEQWREGKRPQVRLERDETAAPIRADGNNVEVDRELTELSRNSMAHIFLTQYLSGTYRSMKMAITGRTT